MTAIVGHLPTFFKVNHGWLRRDPSKHPYLPRRCASVILPGPGGEFLDECPRGRSCPAAHSLEEIQYHPQVGGVWGKRKRKQGR